MYKIFGLGILTLTFVLFLNNNDLEVSASTDPGQSAFLQKREGFLLYNNSDYGFELLYPQDWTVIEGDIEPGDYVTNIVFFEPLGEKGKHYSKKYPCGEVCLGIFTDNTAIAESNLEQYADSAYNALDDQKGPFKLLEYNSASKLGDKRAFELLFEDKQGNREYLQKVTGTTYPDPDKFESKIFLVLQFKSRTKYSNEMLPLGQTMIDSFRFNDTKIPFAPVDSK